MASEPDVFATLPRSAPEAQGLPSAAVLAFLDAVERQNLGLHSLMVLRHGHVVAEGWWTPYAADRPHMLFSLSKSFTATAAGLAVSEGHLSLDDAVLTFFPDAAPEEPSPHLAAMRVRHLLSMSSGHDQDTTGQMRAAGDGDWVQAFLSLPVEHAPGTHFVYNSGATYLVSAIVQKATGQRVLDYLRPRLFDPLGITDPTWETSPQGIDVGGWGLSIQTEDIARFGQLYLQKGQWQGKRLLPENWVVEATSKQVENGSDPDSDWAQGYGYQFWRCRHDAYRGDGAFGQFCVVLPAQDAVVAITAGSANMGGVMNLLWEHLLPAFSSAPLPGDPAREEALTQRLGTLALRGPQGAATAPTADRVSGRRYLFAPQSHDLPGDNISSIESLTWAFDDRGCVMTIRDNRGEHRIEAGADAWRPGKTAFHGSETRPIAAWGAWADEDTYAVNVCFSETPFLITLTSRFSQDAVQLTLRQNVSFGPAERPMWEGRWE